MDEEGSNEHDAVADFATFEDFLDSKIESIDLYYLEVVLILS